MGEEQVMGEGPRGMGVDSQPSQAQDWDLGGKDHLGETVAYKAKGRGKEPWHFEVGALLWREHGGCS